ncbi:MAG: hypothetical protein KatS3mg031_1240 [Chitinophagales bacterium]|nr:MAG: hypothetical protein KatS3mg031_1240 [Chitinophagales bacterium]
MRKDWRCIADERYWRWCTFIPEEEAMRMLLASDDSEGAAEYLKRKKALVHYHKKEGTINDSLYADMHLVLPNDMLTKVDMMSMANSLEVRVPFLDHRVVDFVFSLPAEFKIHKGMRKRILKDAFQDLLPPQIQKRGKQGFEVPLLRWFTGELRPLITNDLLSAERVRSQGLFDVQVIEKLKRQLFSASPGEAVSRVWGLIVFQYWYKKYLD